MFYKYRPMTYTKGMIVYKYSLSVFIYISRLIEIDGQSLYKRTKSMNDVKHDWHVTEIM